MGTSLCRALHLLGTLSWVFPSRRLSAGVSWLGKCLSAFLPFADAISVSSV